jgi:hypothetical protein
MKLMKRTGIYKGSNVTFDPNTLKAHSYNWWLFVAKIGGKVVFNNYSYSVSTSKHQSKVRGIMSKLGINIDLFVEAPEGLDNLDNSLGYMRRRIDTLLGEISKGRESSRAQAVRRSSLLHYETAIRELTILSNLDFAERQNRLALADRG